MDSTHNHLGRRNKMLDTSKSSHIISKLKAASSGRIHETNSITPTIRIVQIFAPKIFKTDPANFRALVQKLTGRSSARSPKKAAQKKPNPPVSPKQRDSIDFKRSVSQARSPEDHSHGSAVVVDHFFSKNPAKNEVVWCEDQIVSRPAEINTEYLEEGGVKMCDIFSGFFGGFEEPNIFNAFMESQSMLPEIRFMNPGTTSCGVKMCDIFPGCFGGFEEQNIFNTLMESQKKLPKIPIMNPPATEQIDYYYGPAGFSHFYQQ